MVYVTKSDLPELNEYTEYLKTIWASGQLTNNGPFVKLLEEKLQNYLGVKNLLLVTNGTVALQLAIKALNLTGEIITTPFTFAATTNVIVWEGLKPVFADIDPETYNIDPNEIEKAITPNTTAILAVHVYGNPCYLERIDDIAQKYNLKVIYDAAHAFGVNHYNGPSVLNYGDVSTLSFHATKVFNTIEGGAIIVKNDELYEKVKLLRSFGLYSEEEVVCAGINAKMDEFRTAMGLCNLDNVAANILKRKNIYERYQAELSSKIQFQKILTSAITYNYAYMPVVFETNKHRDVVYEKLLENGIKARKYFNPITSNFKYLSGTEKNNLPNAAKIADRILCLPLYSQLELETVDKIIEIINKAINS